jgi:hypothetical protein
MASWKFLGKDRSPARGFGSPKPQAAGNPLQALILEPILTPSGLVDGFEESGPAIADVDLPDSFDFDPDWTNTDGFTAANSLEPLEDIGFITELSDELNPTPFDGGVFTVGDDGQVTIDFLFDGGAYEGELAIFSLDGMEDYEPGSEAFIREAASRALSDSELGHVVIRDRTEGARFDGELGERNWNHGDYISADDKVFTMRAGDEFGLMLVPKGTVQQVFDNPDVGGATRPLFSMATANPDDAFHVGQIADVTGDGNTFVFEDMRVDGSSDQDYNDLIFQVKGATAEAVDLDRVIDTETDWRDTDLGGQLEDYVTVDPLDPAGNTPDAAQSVSPTSRGSTYTGWVGDLDTQDYHSFTLGADNDLDLKIDGLTANAQVEILDANGNVVETLTSQNAEQIELKSTLGTGTYYVRVSVVEGGNTAYNLSLNATPKLGGITTDGSDAPIFIDGTPVVSSGSGAITPQDAQSNSLINLDAFRADPRFAGIDGSGFSTVVLDTGIDLDDPFFGPDADNNGVADRIVYHYDFADGDANASDVNGHGSNVTSIVAAEDGTHPGMAPGANIIHLKVFKDDGSGRFSYTEQALQWIVANADKYNIASVNMSLGDGGNWSAATSRYGLGDELAALAAKNVITVSAAGNDFFKNNSQQGLAYPAVDPNSLAVGAVYDGNVGGFSYGSGAKAYSSGADRITPFSQRHNNLTDIFAPGAPITGAGPSGPLVTQHGTSQAAPHIAGIAILAQDLARQYLGRRLSPAEYASLLQSTGVTINDGDDENDNVANTGLSFKRVDVLALAEAIVAMATPIVPQKVDLTGQFFNVVQEPRNAGNTLDAQFRIENQEAGNSGNFDVKFYLSTNNYISTYDRYLGSYRVNNVAGNGTSGLLSKTLTLPPKGDPFWNSQGDGSYTIGMIVDANNEVTESNEGNNRNQGEFDDYDRLQINNTKYVDLSGDYFNVIQEPRNAGDSLQAQFRIRNSQVNTSGDFDVKFYISTNDYISTYDRYLGSYQVNSVAGNSTSGLFTKTLRLPPKGDSFWSKGDGTYSIGMIVDGNNEVAETHEYNNSNLGEFDDYDSLRINNTRGKWVTVTINRLKGDFDGWLNDSDFYSRVSFDSNPYSTGNWSRSPTIGGDNDISPNWTFRKYVTGSTVPITIQVYDSDSFLTLGDDHIDIDPSGGRDLNLSYNVNTGRITGDLSGYRGWRMYSRDKGEIWFTVNHS